MLNQTILIKVRQRLNKLASNDYDNIQDWQIVEAFNKGQSDWCRRNLHGLNVKQEGDEQSTSRIDDLQPLLDTVSLVMSERDLFFESVSLPEDYMRWKRISVKAKSECCPSKSIVVYLAEQANRDELLRDRNKKPNFNWGETFAMFEDNKIQVFTNGEFLILSSELTYYKQPIKIQIAGVKDPYTGIVPAVDVPCIFKDDLTEVLIDECAKIIAGDIESQIQMQRQAQTVENNN